MIIMMNPIMRKDTRSALMTFKAYAAIGIFILLNIAVFTVFINGMKLKVPENLYIRPGSLMIAYGAMTAFQAVFASMVSTILAASSVSTEKDRKTMDLLFVTKLSEKNIVMGKFQSSVYIGLLFVVAALPVLALFFYFRVISLVMLIQSLLTIVSYILLFAAMGMFFSARARNGNRTVKSFTATFLAAFALIFLPIILFTLLAASMPLMRDDMRMLFLILTPSPLAGFASLLDAQFGFGIIRTFMRTQVLEAGGGIWISNAVMNVLLCGLFLLGAVKGIRRD